MIFDQPPAELPVATIVPRDGKSRVRAEIYAWFTARWRWFKPRTVPMIVAFVGMLAVLGAASWLRNYARRAPDRLVVEQARKQALVIVDAPAPPATIVIDPEPRDASMMRDDAPARRCTFMPTD